MTAPLDPAFVEAEPTLFEQRVAVSVNGGSTWHVRRTSDEARTACGMALRHTGGQEKPAADVHPSERCTRGACRNAFKGGA